MSIDRNVKPDRCYVRNRDARENREGAYRYRLTLSTGTREWSGVRSIHMRLNKNGPIINVSIIAQRGLNQYNLPGRS